MKKIQYEKIREEIIKDIWSQTDINYLKAMPQHADGMMRMAINRFVKKMATNKPKHYER